MAKIKPIWYIMGAIVIAVFLLKPEFKGDFIGAAADIGTAAVDRSMPTSIKAGNTFTTTYTASGMGAGSWGVLIEDAISGGCTPTTLYTGWISPTTTYQMTYDTPASLATCSFIGNYQFGGGTEVSMGGGNSIVVCTDDCNFGQIDCTDLTTRWTCENTDADVCYEERDWSCESFQTVSQECSAGTCEWRCAGANSLKTNALTKITSWAGTPTSGSKMTALDAIVKWAENC